MTDQTSEKKAYCNKCGYVGTMYGESKGIFHPGCDYLAVEIRHKPPPPDPMLLVWCFGGIAFAIGILIYAGRLKGWW